MSLFHPNWWSQASKIVRNRMRTNALHFDKRSLMYRPFFLNACSFNGIMRLKHMSGGVCMQMLFRKSTLQNISHDIGDIAVRLANAGSDRLYVKKRRNHHEFYRYDPVAQKETYISKRDFDTISELAQNAYYRELIPHLQHIAGLMKNEEFDLLKKIPMNVYDNQHPALKNYIRPYYAKCLDEIGTWLRNPGDPRHMLGFKQDDPVIFTEDGVRVRSKTEKFYGDSFPLKTNLLKAAFGQLFLRVTVKCRAVHQSWWNFCASPHQSWLKSCSQPQCCIVKYI